MIWSDHEINFVGAAREIKDLYQFLQLLTFSQLEIHFSTGSPLWRPSVKLMKTF